MREQADRADSRSVTITMSETVYIRLVEQARKYGRTPSARAGELFMAAYAAHFGPTGMQALDAMVARMNDAALAGTARRAPPPPEPVVDLPKVPLIAPPPRGPTLRDVIMAALTDRGRDLMSTFGLTPTESCVIDLLLPGNCYSIRELRLLLPDELHTSSDASLTVIISRLRRKVPMSFTDLQHVQGVGYQMSEACRARIEAAIQASPEAVP